LHVVPARTQMRHYLLPEVKTGVITGDEELHGEAQWQEGLGLSSARLCPQARRISRRRAMVPQPRWLCYMQAHETCDVERELGARAASACGRLAHQELTGCRVPAGDQGRRRSLPARRVSRLGLPNHHL